MLVRKLKAKHDELAKSKLPPDEVAKLLKAGAFLVDVRPKIGAKIGMAPGATNISVFTLKRRLHELPRDRTTCSIVTLAPRPQWPSRCWMRWDSRPSTAAAIRTF